MITTEIDRYPNGAIQRKRTFLNGKLHGIGEKPAVKTYFLSGVTRSKAYMKHGIDKRTHDRPTFVTFYENKAVNCENWTSHRQGIAVLHRRYKPALRIHSYNGKLAFEMYVLHGQEGRNGAGPTAIRYNMRGKVIHTRREKIVNRATIAYTLSFTPQPTTESGDVCAICICAFNRDKVGIGYATVSGCNHQFHETCFMQWIKTNPTCPMCRAAVPVVRVPKKIKKIK